MSSLPSNNMVSAVPVSGLSPLGIPVFPANSLKGQNMPKSAEYSASMSSLPSNNMVSAVPVSGLSPLGIPVFPANSLIDQNMPKSAEYSASMSSLPSNNMVSAVPVSGLSPNDPNNERKETNKIASGVHKTEVSGRALAHTKRWQEKFQNLRNYKSIHGTCSVRKGYPEDPQLYSWVYRQKTQYKQKLEGLKNGLSDERVQLLNSIAFEW